MLFLTQYGLMIQRAIFLPHIQYAHIERNIPLSVFFKWNSVLAGYNAWT